MRPCYQWREPPCCCSSSPSCCHVWLLQPPCSPATSGGSRHTSGPACACTTSSPAARAWSGAATSRRSRCGAGPGPAPRGAGAPPATRHRLSLSAVSFAHPPARVPLPAQALTRFPTLAASRADGRSLKGAIVYHDGQFNDARLAVVSAWLPGVGRIPATWCAAAMMASPKRAPGGGERLDHPEGLHATCATQQTHAGWRCRGLRCDARAAERRRALPNACTGCRMPLLCCAGAGVHGGGCRGHGAEPRRGGEAHQGTIDYKRAVLVIGQWCLGGSRVWAALPSLRARRSRAGRPACHAPAARARHRSQPRALTALACPFKRRGAGQGGLGGGRHRQGRPHRPPARRVRAHRHQRGGALLGRGPRAVAGAPPPLLCPRVLGAGSCCWALLLRCGRMRALSHARRTRRSGQGLAGAVVLPRQGAGWLAWWRCTGKPRPLLGRRFLLPAPPAGRPKDDHALGGRARHPARLLLAGERWVGACLRLSLFSLGEGPVCGGERASGSAPPNDRSPENGG